MNLKAKVSCFGMMSGMQTRKLSDAGLKVEKKQQGFDACDHEMLL